MPFLDINGVSAYHDVTGAGEPVVFLHGGFCSAEVMRPLAEQLTGYAVYSPERVGHGRTADRPGPVSYDHYLADTVAFLDAVGLEKAHVVGFSDGAILSLMLALQHPSRVRSIVPISGNLSPEGVYVPEEQYATAVPVEAHEQLEREYAELSPDGAAHSEDLLAKVMQMWTTEPHIEHASLASIAVPALVMAGDHDVISLDHTRTIAEGITGAQLCIVPAASHMLIRERPGVIGRILQEFLDSVPG